MHLLKCAMGQNGCARIRTNQDFAGEQMAGMADVGTTVVLSRYPPSRRQRRRLITRREFAECGGYGSDGLGAVIRGLPVLVQAWKLAIFERWVRDEVPESPVRRLLMPWQNS